MKLRKREPQFLWACRFCKHTEVGPVTGVRRYCKCLNYMDKMGRVK